MSTCVVCKTVTSKYRCPTCFDRYCSVACCKTHKESCVKQTGDPKTNGSADILKAKGKDFFNKDLFAKSQIDTDDKDDRVSDELLQQLEHRSELKEALCNPHLRAMLENLVNANHPEQAISDAMHEPIFTEFADLCLQIVDRKNSSIEQSADD